MADAKAGDRGMVGSLVGGDHPEGDVLTAAALDPPRASLPDRVGVDDQRHHHLRIVGGAAVAVSAVVGVEGLEVELVHGLDHEPGGVVVGQPVAEIRRQKQWLIAVAAEEVLSHAASSRCKRTETEGVCATPSRETGSESRLIRTRQKTVLGARMTFTGTSCSPVHRKPPSGPSCCPWR